MRRLTLLTVLALAAGGCIETAEAPLAPDAAAPADGDRGHEAPERGGRGDRDPQPEPGPRDPEPSPDPDPEPIPEPEPEPEPEPGLATCPEGWGGHVNRDYCVDGFGCEPLAHGGWCHELPPCEVGERHFDYGPYCVVGEALALSPGFACPDALPYLKVAGPFVACGREGDNWARRVSGHVGEAEAAWAGRCADVDGIEVGECGDGEWCESSWCIDIGTCPAGTGRVYGCDPALAEAPEAVAAQQCFWSGRTQCEVGASSPVEPGGLGCRSVCQGDAPEACWAACDALRVALQPEPFQTWAACTVNTPGRTWEGRAGACAAQLTCAAPEPLIGQHCDALARCSAQGRGWYDEAECRAEPPGDADHWACLAQGPQAAIQDCFQVATCNDMAWCLDVAVCNGGMTCARVWAAEWHVP